MIDFSRYNLHFLGNFFFTNAASVDLIKWVQLFREASPIFDSKPNKNGRIFFFFFRILTS